MARPSSSAHFRPPKWRPGLQSAACVKNMAGPSEKATRYDRQLRLWGDHGQSTLERAQVCLVNASATGTEILKNLVLPGIKAFTIVDPKTVVEEDLGANFFLDVDSVGKGRASCAVDLLVELNNEVKGFAIEENVGAILKRNPCFFSQFSVVIATQMHGPALLELADTLWKQSVPLLIARSHGMLGYVRLVTQEHVIIESHPDNPLEDLRMDRPFPELIRFTECIELEKLSDADHRQVPYPVILLHMLKCWKEDHNGQFPKNYKEKKEFKLLVDAARRSVEEENFDEAVKAVNTAISISSVPSNVWEVLEDSLCIDVSEESTNFWILASALREFVNGEGGGLLPLRGSIPDMFSSSDKYIGLQRLYQARASADAEAVMRHAQILLDKLGRPRDSISEQEVVTFCRHSAFLQVVRTHSLHQENDPQTINASALDTYLDDSSSIMAYYVLLRAADKFFLVHNRFPGDSENQFESDVAEMSKFTVDTLSNELGLPPNSVKRDFVVEFCRSGGAELHSVAAFVGGVVGQEVIKLITHQYVPINNTLLYDAITSSSVTLEF